MTGFWNIWVVTLIIIFLMIMVLVVVKYWKTNHLADKNKTIDTFDGIDENDAPPPRIMFIGYFIAFCGAVIFLVLYPGLGNWPGLLGWQQTENQLLEHNTSLDEQIAKISDPTLMVLSVDSAITTSGML